MQKISGRGAHNAMVKNLNPQVNEKMKRDTLFQVDGNGDISFLEKQEVGGWNTARDFLPNFSLDENVRKQSLSSV